MDGLYRVHNMILDYLGAVAYNQKYSIVHTRWRLHSVHGIQCTTVYSIIFQPLSTSYTTEFSRIPSTSIPVNPLQ